MNRPVVPPETRVVFARLRSFSEVEGRIRLIFVDPGGVTGVYWQDVKDPRPGVGQRVAVEVDDRGRPGGWHPA